MKRKGLGKGLGMGYKNLIPIDRHIHSLSAKGVKSKLTYQQYEKALNKELEDSGFEKPLVRATYDVYRNNAKGKNPVNSKNVLDYIMEYEGGSPKTVDVIYLFSYLIKTGQAWRLQGMYGRQAQALIDNGIIDRKGKINWIKVNQVTNPDEDYYGDDLDAKGKKGMPHLRRMFKFEDMNPDYIESQFEGLDAELKQKHPYEPYVREKIRNSKNQFNQTIDNFENRILSDEELRKEYLGIKLDAKAYALEPRYDSRPSFYGKAQVVEQDNGDLTLFSYDTKVAEIVDRKPIVYGTYSATTLRHIKDFLKQNGFKADSKDQILRDYG